MSYLPFPLYFSILPFPCVSKELFVNVLGVGKEMANVQHYQVLSYIKESYINVVIVA